MDKSDSQLVLSNTHGLFTVKENFPRDNRLVVQLGDAQVVMLGSPSYVPYQTNLPSHDKTVHAKDPASVCCAC